MPDDQHHPAPALAPARKPSPKTVGELLSDEEATSKRLSAVATKYLPAERAARLAIAAVRKVPKLALCSPISFLGALMGATGLGLEPNTPKEHAYLIPYEKRLPRKDQNGNILKDEQGKWLWDSFFECQLQLGYRGFVTLFYRSPLIKAVKAESIFDVDHFKHMIGTKTFLEYEKCMDKPRERLKGAFCFTSLQDEGQAFTVLPAEEIWKARSRSQAWQTATKAFDEAQTALENAGGRNADRLQRALFKAKQNLDETPWVMWLPDMAAKTAIRRHAKQTDLGDEVEATRITVAADLDALSDAGLVDMTALANPDQAREIIKGEQDAKASTEASADGEGEENAGEPKEPGPADSGTATPDAGVNKTDAPPAEAANQAAKSAPKPAPSKELF